MIHLSALAFPQIDPVLLRLGPLEVHWYGLAYVAGILFGWWYARRLVSTPRLWAPHASPIRAEELDDFLTWAALGIVIGGRLGYVLFYNAGFYFENPLQAFAVWDGGMSFHGGALGAIAAMVLFARSRGFSPFSLLDVIATVSCVGLLLGRIANFVNSELWGRTTDVAWAVVFPTGGPVGRHPSQLYEGLLEGLVLFAVLNWLIWSRGRLATPGFVGGAWVFGYGLARIFVEFFREPDAQLGYLAGGWLTMGMLLSLPMLAVGAWGMATASGRVPWRNVESEQAVS